eukprot:TRINITY_DN14987_c0_g1_i1.p1 TRINITY_DN14987_c0_g1~~TRINITY_DN14987_c0_g1_i1.p1  ORF type:complete len:908 (-),score=128.68 TRINITY_DN14987_c0_g1_i1:64-2787(-)
MPVPKSMLCGCSPTKELQPEPAGLGYSLQRLQNSLERSLGARLDRIETSLAGIERGMCQFAEMGPTATTAAAYKPMSWSSGSEAKDTLEELPALDKASLEANGSGSSSSSKAHALQRGDAPAESSRVDVVVSEGPLRLSDEVREHPTLTRLDSGCKTFAVREDLLKEMDHDELSNWDVDAAGIGGNSRIMLEKSSRGERVTSTFIWRLRPSSPLRLHWDVLGMLMIIYDLMLIPLDLAFDLPDNSGLHAMFWITLLFWTLDIPVTFISGYYIKGTEEIRLARIAIAYLRTWFLLDVGIVGLDWWFVFSNQERSGGIAMVRVGKSLRFLRILRAARLLRLAKLRKILEVIQDSLQTEYSHLLANMMKLVFLILTCNHIIACAWYALSTAAPDTENAWVKEVKGDRDQAFFYLTSVHWSLTQFTPASMEIYPRNSKERLFAVLVLMFALLVFSSFLSSITAAMTQLRQMSSLGDKNVSVLRRYLRSRQIDASLSIRILRYVEHQLTVQKYQIQESDVRLLKLMSKPLQKELITETHAPILCKHPYFDVMKKVSALAIRDVCNRAISSLALSEGDNVFTSGSIDDNMVFVTEGRLLYLTTRRDSVSNTQALAVATGSTPARSSCSLSGSGLLEVVPTLKVNIVGLHGIQLDSEHGLCCSCELMGKERSHFRTDAVPATPDYEWNHWDTLVGYADGDTIVFQIWCERGDDDMNEMVVESTLDSTCFVDSCFDGEVMMELPGAGGIAYLTVRIERCEYGEIAHRSRSRANGLGISHLDAGEWCCEASLWTSWTHLGTLVADTFSQVNFLHAKQFAEAITQHGIVAVPTRKYATVFVEALNAQSYDGILTDVELQLFSNNLINERVQACFEQELLLLRRTFHLNKTLSMLVPGKTNGVVKSSIARVRQLLSGA